MSGSVLLLSAVSKRYLPVAGQAPVVALDRVDLAIGTGQFVAVMGPSGSGKSTLLRVASGIEAVDSGGVSVLGVDLTTASAGERARVRRVGIGLVFQQLNLLTSLTAAENVMLPLELGPLRSLAGRDSLSAATSCDPTVRWRLRQQPGGPRVARAPSLRPPSHRPLRFRQGTTGQW